jgi:hypothetical protein
VDDTDGRFRKWLHTCTIITGEPNEFLREMHTRMESSHRKSVTILGYLAKPEKKSWSLTRQIE